MTFNEWWDSIPSDTPMKKDTVKNRYIRGVALAAWQAAQLQWQPIETAPKDGTMFLGKFCYSWPVCAAWNEPAEKFCIAQLQVGLYHGKWNDAYFEHDYVSAKELLAWRPLPQLPEDKPHEHAKFTKRS